MGRYTGPTEKLSRREGVELELKGARRLARKGGLERRGDAPPGQHGNARRRRESVYGLQLREKQRAKRYYGMRERQFRKVFREAQKSREGQVGERLMVLLERRLDNVVYRLGLATTRAQARQFVNHRHVQVNGRRVDIAPFFGPLSAAEVRYLMKHEWARTADDVLWRRSKLGLKLTPAEKDALVKFMTAAPP